MLNFRSVKDDSVIITREVALAHFIDIFIMTVEYLILLSLVYVDDMK